MTQEQLDARLAHLDAVIENYGAKLEALSLDPKPSYSLDGETFDREKWRDHLMKGIQDATELQLALVAAFNAQHPYFVSTRQVLR